MSDLQFALFFAALLVGYVLVHLRMVRFEAYLQNLVGIRTLDERLRSLDECVKQLAERSGSANLERVSAQLERLHDDLEDLREATGEVRSAVVHSDGDRFGQHRAKLGQDRTGGDHAAGAVAPVLVPRRRQTQDGDGVARA